MNALKLSHSISEPRLIYVGDVMCSWCWGFEPVLQEVHEEFPDVKKQLMLGALRPGPMAEKLNENMARFLRHHWHEVHKATGQPFDYKFLKRDDGFIYDTEHSAKAVYVMRSFDEKKAWQYYFELQGMFYRDGVDPTNVTNLIELAQKYDIDAEEFQLRYNDDNIKQALYNEFAQAMEWGVSGFPTVLYWYGDKLYTLSRGYMPKEQLFERIQSVLEHTTELAAKESGGIPQAKPVAAETDPAPVDEKAQGPACGPGEEC